ncbi:MAG: amidohydrolase family protein [Myxococcaceae bacterium]|nr:amidohydrolase family protein [Myxococcaceae bacterium]
MPRPTFTAQLPPDVGPACCLAASAMQREGITLPLPGLNDEEGPRLPDLLPPVVDAHVHLFPDAVFDALWNWFDTHAWPVRYKLRTPQVIRFLLDRGLSHVVALHYSHRAGMARALNTYVAEVCRTEPKVIGLATVFPGEPGAAQILTDAFAAGLKGVKLHCHVQCFAPDAPELHEIYATCAAHGRPLVMHAGREPKSSSYRVDPYQLCAVERVQRVLEDHPTLKLCVPHLGADEFDGYLKLLERYPNLWLDTTMMASAFFPIPVPLNLFAARPDRLLYGTDFPNIPYAWDRELKQLLKLKLPAHHEASVLGGNALRLFGVA